MQRHCSDHVLVERCWVQARGHGRRDVARAHRVAPDARYLEAQRGVLGNPDDGRLGAYVRRSAAAALPRNGGHVDDGGAGRHAPGSRTHAAHGSLLVGLDDAVEVLVGVAVDGLEAALEHACVVDQNVNPPVPLHRSGHEALGIIRLGDVRGNDEGLAAELGDLRGDLLKGFGATRAHDHLGALRGKEPRNGGSHARVCPGDNGNLVCETVHCAPFAELIHGVEHHIQPDAPEPRPFAVRRRRNR